MLLYVRPEDTWGGAESWDSPDDTLAGIPLGGGEYLLTVKDVSGASIAAAGNVKHSFGYHGPDWKNQNTANDYSNQSCSSSNANSRVVLCRRVSGVWYSVWGTPPTWDTLGCERL